MTKTHIARVTQDADTGTYDFCGLTLCNRVMTNNTPAVSLASWLEPTDMEDLSSVRARTSLEMRICITCSMRALALSDRGVTS
jgi:hypothetical protein